MHLYKREGDRAQCNNHRGISLLSTAGKILARIILNRLTAAVTDTVYPESQCGFRGGRGTADMIFAFRQLQEKCKEQNTGFYIMFVDLMKAFNTINWEGLWKVLSKVGCPGKLVSLIRAVHQTRSSFPLDLQCTIRWLRQNLSFNDNNLVILKKIIMIRAILLSVSI